jgi:hypothetical protein
MLEVFLNAAVSVSAIDEASNNQLSKAQSLSSSFEAIGPIATRGAVVGKTGIYNSSDLSDYYSFTLAAGQTVTLAVSDESGDAGTINVALLNSSGTALASGTAMDTDVDGAIENFTATTAGTYYAEVTGNAADITYVLVVTRGADFGLEANSTEATAQNISGTVGVLGAIEASAPTDCYAVNLAAGAALALQTYTYDAETDVDCAGPQAVLEGVTLGGGTTGVLVETGASVTIDAGATISGATTGVDVQAGGSATLSGSVVENSTVANVELEGAGSSVSGGTLEGDVTAILITGTGDTASLVTVDGVQNDAETDVDCAGSQAVLEGVTLGGGTTGVLVETGASVTIDAGATISGATTGVVVQAGGSAMISGSTISDNTTGIELDGSDSSASGGTITGNSTGISITGIGDTANIAEIDVPDNGIGIQVTGTGAVIETQSSSGTEGTIRSEIDDASPKTAIEFSGQGDGTVTGLSINGMTTAGIAIGDVNGDGRSDLADNTLTDNACGLDVEGDGQADLTGNTFTDDTTAIYVNSTFVPTSTQPATITSTDDTISIDSGYKGGTSVGVEMDGEENPTESVSLNFAAIQGANVGIEVDEGNLTVEGDTLSGNATGVLVGPSGSATIEDSSDGTTPTTISGGAVAIDNSSLAAVGVLVSGTNQVVGAISGTGNLVVDAGSDLTADSIVQNTLSIGAGATLTITPSGSGISTDSATNDAEATGAVDGTALAARIAAVAARRAAAIAAILASQGSQALAAVNAAATLADSSSAAAPVALATIVPAATSPLVAAPAEPVTSEPAAIIPVAIPVAAAQVILGSPSQVIAAQPVSLPTIVPTVLAIVPYAIVIRPQSPVEILPSGSREVQPVSTSHSAVSQFQPTIEVDGIGWVKFAADLGPSESTVPFSISTSSLAIVEIPAAATAESAVVASDLSTSFVGDRKDNAGPSAMTRAAIDAIFEESDGSLGSFDSSLLDLLANGLAESQLR